MELEPPEARLRQYASARGLKILRYVGGGTDGSVWETDRKTVAKVFQYQKNYYRELHCYQRLRRHAVTRVRQFSVPRLIESDNGLAVVEMSIVSPPCLIDFGKAYLNEEPEHLPETWAEHHREQQEIWEDKYQEVQSVLRTLRTIGNIYRDAKPANIMFGS